MVSPLNMVNDFAGRNVKKLLMEQSDHLSAYVTHWSRSEKRIVDSCDVCRIILKKTSEDKTNVEKASLLLQAASRVPHSLVGIVIMWGMTVEMLEIQEESFEISPIDVFHHFVYRTCRSFDVTGTRPSMATIQKCLHHADWMLMECDEDETWRLRCGEIVELIKEYKQLYQKKCEKKICVYANDGEVTETLRKRTSPFDGRLLVCRLWHDNHRLGQSLTYCDFINDDTLYVVGQPGVRKTDPIDHRLKIMRNMLNTKAVLAKITHAEERDAIEEESEERRLESNVILENARKHKLTSLHDFDPVNQYFEGGIRTSTLEERNTQIDADQANKYDEIQRYVRCIVRLHEHINESKTLNRKSPFSFLMYFLSHRCLWCDLLLVPEIRIALYDFYASTRILNTWTGSRKDNGATMPNTESLAGRCAISDDERNHRHYAAVNPKSQSLDMRENLSKDKIIGKYIPKNRLSKHIRAYNQNYNRNRSSLLEHRLSRSQIVELFADGGTAYTDDIVTTLAHQYVNTQKDRYTYDFYDRNASVTIAKSYVEEWKSKFPFVMEACDKTEICQHVVGKVNHLCTTNERLMALYTDIYLGSYNKCLLPLILSLVRILGICGYVKVGRLIRGMLPICISHGIAFDIDLFELRDFL